MLRCGATQVAKPQDTSAKKYLCGYAKVNGRAPIGRILLLSSSCEGAEAVHIVSIEKNLSDFALNSRSGRKSPEKLECLGLELLIDARIDR